MDLTGRTLNHYRIAALLGRGGMGEVYAAEDLRLGRPVALKILPEALAGNPDRRMRFEREARAVAALSHPNIVTIYSVEEAEGVHFLTMEMVSGSPLSRMIPKGGMTLESLLGLAVPLADAVGTAHRKGIIHRDLKPDNIVVGEDGRLRVLDFGLAKLRPDAGSPASATQLPTEVETQEGKIVGTIAYMSPEQAEGKPVDARSDIFSLGVVLYEMATGLRPFRGDTPISTISSILRDTPESILDLNRGLPRHLGRIVGRCLAKDPDRRYQTAIDLRNDLEGLREEVQSGEAMAESLSAPAPRSRRGWLIAGAAMVAALVIGYSVSRLLDRPGAAPSGAFEGMEMIRLTSDGRSGEGAISPDGKYVVYVERGPKGSGLRLRQVSQPSTVQIVPWREDSIYDPVFSPEGDSIYFIGLDDEKRDPVLYRVPVLGGAPVKVLEGVSERISFSPDGSRFVFLRFSEGSTALFTASRDGGDLRAIAVREQPEEIVGDPVWSTDGKMVATAVVRWTGRMDQRLILFPVDGKGEEVTLGRAWGGITEMDWLPDGGGLVMEAQERTSGSSQLWEISYPGGESRRITNDLNSYHGAIVSGDGRTLVTTMRETRTELWALTGGELSGNAVRVPGIRPSGYGVSWLPDGRITYASLTSEGSEIWITDPAGNATQITAEGGENYDPVICDGRHIVFVSNRTGSHNLWRMDLDGGNKLQLTSGEGEFLPRCPTGRGMVVFEQQGPGLLYLASVGIDGGEITPLSEELPLAWWTLSVSPDGRRIAYFVSGEGTRQWVLEILSLEDGGITRRDDIAIQYESQTRWGPDGDSIHYVVDDNGVENIWSRPLEGGSPEQLTDFEEDDIGAFSWSADGRSLALLRVKSSTDVVLLREFR